MFYFNLRLTKSPIYSKCRSSVQLFNHLLTLFEFFISNKGLMVDLIFFWLSWDTFFYGKHCLSSVSYLLFLRRTVHSHAHTTRTVHSRRWVRLAFRDHLLTPALPPRGVPHVTSLRVATPPRAWIGLMPLRKACDYGFLRHFCEICPFFFTRGCFCMEFR